MTKKRGRSHRRTISAFAVFAVSAILLAGACSKSPPPPKGPVGDLTVGPGLSVILDTSEAILVSVATLKGKEATPTYAGRLLGHAVSNKAGDKPADGDVRLRFAVSHTMPARGEPPAWFASAADKKIAELALADAAEFIYTGGDVALTVSTDGKSVVLIQK